jgi:hypothetical protein
MRKVREEPRGARPSICNLSLSDLSLSRRLICRKEKCREMEESSPGGTCRYRHHPAVLRRSKKVRAQARYRRCAALANSCENSNNQLQIDRIAPNAVEAHYGPINGAFAMTQKKKRRPRSPRA